MKSQTSSDPRWHKRWSAWRNKHRTDAVERCPYCGQTTAGGPHPHCVRRVRYAPGEHLLAEMLKEAVRQPGFPEDIRDRLLSQTRIAQWIQYAREMIHRAGGCAPVLIRMIRDRRWVVLGLFFRGYKWRMKVLMDMAARNLSVPPVFRRMIFRRSTAAIRDHFARRFRLSKEETLPVMWAFLALAAAWRGPAAEQEFVAQLDGIRQKLPEWVDRARRVGVAEDIEVIVQVMFGQSIVEEVEDACGYRGDNRGVHPSDRGEDPTGR